ncbi:ABC transporter ATP-binding protein [Singulisphaera acidiphila]|uniref:ABC-type antimicrobial peptide transport system, ATPase component n=1 Tax=Singulisphaera acidiphila (strain ATCC BAA-1392 / DSM 18658 / VKM B-2454 / MOB10) TaxID=886293 RepID=L0DC40_SINAD|nr:ABC transporter ATP-binding protein [Singulisphaera acidiphila]AGA26420.1 ABC-type antimicrobial peptide transport system, ATPase component [Singulisphaera acidiphila DSM 18658]
MSSVAPALAAQNLHRAFGSGDEAVQVLRDVSIELYEGQVLLLMGPSGSGKSTLLAVLSGLLRPDQGQVRVLGKDLWRMREAERERFRLSHFGFVFQGFNLFPSLTASEQLEMVVRWGEGASRGEARRRVGEILERLGLGRRAHLRADRLSGGEKQRVAVGRALLKHPRFCFADEPTGSLDWGHGEQIIRLLQSAARDRGAVLFMVGHDPRLVPYADRVLHLVDGQLADETTPAPTPSEVPS